MASVQFEMPTDKSDPEYAAQVIAYWQQIEKESAASKAKVRVADNVNESTNEFTPNPADAVRVCVCVCV